jgi:hypothetical protein
LAFSIDRFATVVAATVTDVLADMGLWGWTMPLLIVVVVVSLIQKRSVGDLWTLCWIAAILLALEFVGTLFASAVVSQTIRRGVFKLIPLMYLFMARSPMVAMMSDALQRWEAARGTPPTPARKG